MEIGLSCPNKPIIANPHNNCQLLDFIFDQGLIVLGLRRYAFNNYKYSSCIEEANSLDLGNPLNYIPITMSSTLAKLFELLILPTDFPLCFNQFGFRNDYSVSHGICLLNDLICYSKYHNSNMFMVSMDAEKCFDSIWHDDMLYRLYSTLSNIIYFRHKRVYQHLLIVCNVLI